MPKYRAPKYQHKIRYSTAQERDDYTGRQFSTGDDTHVTINPTDDPRAPGGHYVSIGDSEDHSTAVFNPDGTLADVKANRDWTDSPRQD